LNSENRAKPISLFTGVARDDVQKIIKEDKKK